MRHSIGFFFLAIFLMVKMAGLHVLAHEGDQDHYAHCIVCDHVVKGQDAPELFLASTEYVINVPGPIPQEQVSNEYEFLFDGVLTIDQLFSRPPPSLI
ncbi:MAG: hypothetical protein NXH90_12705 [Flavobacteriaceae bacterium]|nr:hypothetical protein [Flavobacteriaceae bacterium]